MAPDLPSTLRLLALAAGIALSACEGDSMNRIKPGVTTEREVLERLGTPHAVWPLEGGGQVLEYPRGPEGTATYMITLGQDRIVREVRQVLAEQEFAKIRAGMTVEEVRRTLGRPTHTQVFPLKREEVWDWRFVQDYVPMEFHVHFDASGHVVGTSRTRRHDPS